MYIEIHFLEKYFQKTYSAIAFNIFFLCFLMKKIMILALDFRQKDKRKDLHLLKSCIVYFYSD